MFKREFVRWFLFIDGFFWYVVYILVNCFHLVYWQQYHACMPNNFVLNFVKEITNNVGPCKLLQVCRHPVLISTKVDISSYVMLEQISWNRRETCLAWNYKKIYASYSYNLISILMLFVYTSKLYIFIV